MRSNDLAWESFYNSRPVKFDVKHLGGSRYALSDYGECLLPSYQPGGRHRHVLSTFRHGTSEFSDSLPLCFAVGTGFDPNLREQREWFWRRPNEAVLRSVSGIEHDLALWGAAGA